MRDWNTMTDEELLACSIKEPEAFRELVLRYQVLFLGRVKRIVGTMAADDIVQDTFVKIYINAKQYRPAAGSFRSWAYTILLNTAYSHCRRSQREQLVLHLEAELMEELPDPRSREIWETKLLRDEILFLLSRLPQQISRIMRLKYFDELADKQIADLENMTPGAVRTAVSRARASLRNFLSS